ncbi:AAA family ATPase [Actinoplanes sp. NPDC023936]|uniref:ATP-binding protein n=1 Tax=Actinoplanes sp. NPDC023936 TaxID=3154910 RepID=UPI00340217D7
MRLVTTRSGRREPAGHRAPRPLLGRRPERERLRDLLDSAHAEAGTALVVHGEAGVGKTALIETTLAELPPVRTLRADGTEFETALAFAALHQLVAPLLNTLDALPEPQRQALAVSFGLETGPAPDPYLVGLAVLSLLSAAARDEPVVCVVSDAQWLDRSSARALSFAARRLAGTRVAILLELRGTDRLGDFDALPALAVEPLPDHDARALLLSALPTPLDEQVRDRILAEARGNPLALLELSAASDPVETAGGFGVPAGDTGRLESLFRRRLAGLPAETRRLLLLAAAEPVGDPVLLWRAAHRLAIPLTATVPAEDTGLLHVDVRVRFRHPLVRSAAYRAASPTERRRVHAALAEVTDRRRDPDRRAWHRAQAAAGPDEELAAELIRSAGRARLRGGLPATAAFLERAAALSPDPDRRADRLLDAAQCWLDADLPDEAHRLLSALDEPALHPRSRARHAAVRGRLALSVRHFLDAVPALRQAATLLESVASPDAPEAHLDALLAAVMAGTGTEQPRPATTVPSTTTGLLLSGITGILDGHRVQATPRLRAALADTKAPVWTPRPLLTALVALEMWDLSAYEQILGLNAERARTAGALTLLPQTLEALAGAAVATGHLGRAEQLRDEAADLGSAVHDSPANYCGLYLKALRGPRDTARAAIEETRRDAAARGEGLLVGYSYLAGAVMNNGTGDYADAITAARSAWEVIPFGFTGMALRELVEAAARDGQPQRGRIAFAALRERTRAAGTAWALGTEATCAALLAEGQIAERHYRTALDHLEQAGAGLERARTSLLYGEWLRRQRRRGQAREHLLAAHDAFTALNIDSFAERAARELRATGQRTRRGKASVTVAELTPQETHVGRLAATGATSKAIAAQLFLSPRTVDAHLRSIYRKLDISSRRELWGTILDNGGRNAMAG